MVGNCFPLCLTGVDQEFVESLTFEIQNCKAHVTFSTCGVRSGHILEIKRLVSVDCCCGSSWAILGLFLGQLLKREDLLKKEDADAGLQWIFGTTMLFTLVLAQLLCTSQC